MGPGRVTAWARGRIGLPRSQFLDLVKWLPWAPCLPRPSRKKASATCHPRGIVWPRWRLGSHTGAIVRSLPGCPLVMSSLGSFPRVEGSSRTLVPASEAPCQRPIQESSSLAAAQPREAKANGHLSGQYRPDSRRNAPLPPGCSEVYDMARRPSGHPLCRQPRGGSHRQ